MPGLEQRPVTASDRWAALAPLRRRLVFWLWLAALASNVGTWVQNVGAAWLMTRLAESSLLVTLVQAATSLPVCFLALPAGVVADIVDRRRLLLVTQTWMLLAAAALAALAAVGWVSPATLLALTFVLGLGAAVNAPAWASLPAELVPLDEVPAVVALNSVAFNAARAVGPALGGLLVAAAGPAAAFLLNAVSFVGVVAVLAAWRRPRTESALPAERFVGALRAGLRYVRHSAALHAILGRAALFVLGASGLWALLPVLTRDEADRGPVAYGALLGCLGGGAVLGAGVLPPLRRRLGADGLVVVASAAFGLVALGVALVPAFAAWCPLLVVGGAAWLAVMTSLNAATQSAAPTWVRARALGVYMLVFFGGMGLGSVGWGWLADRTGPATALAASGLWVLLGLLAAWRWRLPQLTPADLEPSRHWPEIETAVEIDPHDGPVLVTVEYRIDPARADEFRAAAQPLRGSRLRSGALRWDLFQDAAEPERFVEVFLVESWAEHLRQHERVTAADRVLQDKVTAFHKGPMPPVVRHLVASEGSPGLPTG